MDDYDTINFITVSLTRRCCICILLFPTFSQKFYSVLLLRKYIGLMHPVHLIKCFRYRRLRYTADAVRIVYPHSRRVLFTFYASNPAKYCFNIQCSINRLKSDHISINNILYASASCNVFKS